MEFYFRRFLCEFGQLVQAQQVRLSDIFEIRTDCHRKAHEMRNIYLENATTDRLVNNYV